MERDGRHKSRCGDTTPWNVDAERGGDIDEQHHRQKLQVARIAVVGDKDFGCKTGEAEQQRIGDGGSVDDEAKRGSHGGQVGGDVDGVGDHEHCHQRVHDRLGKLPRDILGQPAFGAPADARTDDLNCRHKR